jgi:hypothetical protein
MITNSSKENCTHDMSASVLRTAVWRRQLCTRFPEDARNIRAAEKLEQLTGEITDSSDDAWTELAPYYNWCSAKWSGRGFACIAACGFRNVKTLPAFVDCLVGILSQNEIAA